MTVIRMLICPLHLQACAGKDCDIDCCEVSRLLPLTDCELCGELHEPWCDPPVCPDCDNKEQGEP